MNAVTQTVAAEPVSGVEIFVPLAKLKKSPRNARKVPHGDPAPAEPEDADSVEQPPEVEDSEASFAVAAE